MIIYIFTSKIFKTGFKNGFFDTQQPFEFEGRNSSGILCSRKTGIKCWHLRICMYKIFFLFSFSLEERKRKKIEDKSVDSKSSAAK